MAQVNTPKEIVVNKVLVKLMVPLLAGLCNFAWAQDPVNLEMTVWGGETDVKTYTERLAMCTEGTATSVKLTPIPTEYDQKLLTRIAGGNSPDIMMFAEQIHAYSGRGQLVPLDGFVEAAGLDMNARFAPESVELYRRDDQLYALPDRSGAMVMYYNKNLFDAAGVAYPSAEWTWDDLLSAAQALTVRDESGTVTQWGFSVVDWSAHWLTFMYQNGGGILDEEGRPIVNSEENVEAIQFFNDLIFEHGVAPSPEVYANLGVTSPDTLFAQGKLAMNITGFWNIASLTSVDDFEWNIAPMFGEVQNATAPFFSGLGISRDSQHPEEAFQVISCMTDVPAQERIAANAEDAPANLQVLQSDAFLNPEWASADVNMEAFAQSQGMLIDLPLIPEWNEMLKAFGDNLSGVFINGGDVSGALNAVQSQLEFIIQ